MHFVHPHFLWLLALPAVLACLTAAQRQGRWRWLVVPTRALCLSTLILALARPIGHTNHSRPVQVCVIDISPSIPFEEVARGLEIALAMKSRALNSADVHLVAFANRIGMADVLVDGARIDLESFRRELWVPLTNHDPAAGGSAIADAIGFAGALIGDRDGEILLLTDGRETRGDAARAATAIASRGIHFSVQSLSANDSGGIRITKITSPGSAHEGQTVSVAFEVESPQPGTTTASIYQDDRVIGKKLLDLPRGTSEQTIEFPAHKAGMMKLKIGLGESQAASANRDLAIWVSGPRRVVMVDESSTKAAAKVLATILGESADITRCDGADLPTNLEQFDLLVLANCPKSRISDISQTAIERAVRQGVGLLVTGGPEAFGAGGWSESALVSIWPVSLSQESEKQDPSTTAVFIVDTSGSMTGPRIELAKEVVRLALRRLQPQDKAGIVEFYGSKRWAAPIQSAGNHLDLNRALNRLTSGGGTVILPAIEEAAYAIRNTNTRTRHVIILTDGGVESGPFESIVRKMAQDGATVSTVLVGPGQHSAFLASIARWGGGRFYHAPDRFNLPELMFRMPQSRMLPAYVQTPSAIGLAERDDVTRGIDFSTLPPIPAYVRVKAKSGADTLLTAGSGDPLLTRWQIGRGNVAVFAADLGNMWNDPQAKSPALASVVATLARSIYGLASQDALQVSCEQGTDRIEVRVQSQNGSSLSPLEIELRQGDGTVVRKMIVDAERPGRWQAQFESVSPGIYQVVTSITDENAKSYSAVTVVGPDEDGSTLQASRVLDSLARIAADSKSTHLREKIGKEYQAVEYWQNLVIVAVIMLVLNVLFRRWSVSARRPVHALALTILSIALAGSSASADIMPLHLLLTKVAELECSANNPQAIALLRSAISENRPAPDQRVIASRLMVMEAEFSVKPTAESRPDPMVAALFGRFDLVGKDAPLEYHPQLLQGTAMLRAENAREARESFSQAYRVAPTAKEKRFAIERLISSYRLSGHLPELLSDWRQTPETAERILPMIGLLRELGRAEEAMAMWDRLSRDKQMRSLVSQPRVVAEFIAVARDSRRLPDAERIVRQAIEDDPQVDRWLNVYARLLIEQDREADADSFLKTTAERAQSPAKVLQCAQIAHELGRDEVAIEIAESVSRLETDSSVTAGLLVAQIQSHRGNRNGALDRLSRCADLSAGNATRLISVAEALEQLGDRQGAIRLYEQATTLGADVRAALCAVLEQEGKLPEAREVWREIWRDPKINPARHREAQDRLLDLSSRTGTLADLAGELEEKLAGGTATSEDLSALIDIYVGARDIASAAEILSSAKALAGGEIAAQSRLANLYIKCGRLGQADRMLRDLVKLDPEHATDYWQQLAVLAIERKRPADAQAALSEIARQSGDESSSAELRAGIYDRLGLYDEAAKGYRQSVEANPERIEDWILWAGATAKTGHKNEAIEKLLQLASSAEEDDLFTVAVDGLLNLEAPRESLVIARRYAMARLACNPKKLIFYQLIRDISETISDPILAVRVGELSLLVAGEQRTEIIRELISLCKTSGQTDRSIELGRMLVGLGDQIPPQAFFDIGKQVLDSGNFADADRAFSRAMELSGDDQMRIQIGKLYESAGQLRLAGDTLHPLVRLHPNDLDLRCRVGGMHEQIGELDAACNDYLVALRLILQRANGTEGAPTTRSRRTSTGQRGETLSEVDQYLDPVIDGLVACARDNSLVNKILSQVSQNLHAELLQAKEQPAVPRKIYLIGSTLRRLAFAMHKPAIADEFDLTVAKRFPTDTDFAANIVRFRFDWGLHDRAAEIAKEIHQRLPSELERLLAEPGETVTNFKDPDVVADNASHLLISGKVEDVRKILQSCPLEVPKKTTTYGLMVSSALATGDMPLAGRWAQLWLDQTFSRSSGEPSMILPCARGCWPVLSTDQRRAMLAQLESLLSRMEGDGKATLAMFCLQCAGQLNEPAEHRLKLAMTCIGEKPLQGNAIAEIVSLAGIENGSTILKAAMEIVPVRAKRSTLQQFGSTMQRPIDGPLLQDFLALFRESRKGDTADRSDALVGISWARNPLQKKLNIELIRILTAERPSDLTTKLASAMVSQQSGDQPAADAMAKEIINGVMDRANPARNDLRLLDESVGILSQRACADFVNATQAAKGEKPLAIALRAIMLLHMGKESEAGAMLAEAVRQQPADQELRRLVTEKLAGLSRWKELVDIFKPFENDESVVNRSQRLQLLKAYRQLGRFEEAAALILKEDGPLKPLQRLQNITESGTPAQILPVFRAFHVENRWQRRSFVPYIQPLDENDGMKGYLSRRSEGRPQRMSIYRLVAPLPWSTDELYSLLAIVTPDSNDVDVLADAIGAVSDPGQRELLLDRLKNCLGDRSLTRKDRILMSELSSQGWALPSELIGEVSRSIGQIDPLDVSELPRQIDFLRTAGERDRAKEVSSWITSVMIVMGRSGIVKSGNMLQLQSLRDVPSHLVEAAAPGPGEHAEDILESARIARLLEIDSQAAQAALDSAISDAGGYSSRLHLKLLQIRLSAKSGDVGSACRQVNSLVEMELSRATLPRVIDLRPILSADISTDHFNTIALSAGRELKSRAENNPALAALAIRSICLLSAECISASHLEAAMQCRDLAAQIKTESADASRWRADLTELLSARRDK